MSSGCIRGLCFEVELIRVRCAWMFGPLWDRIKCIGISDYGKLHRVSSTANENGVGILGISVPIYVYNIPFNNIVLGLLAVLNHFSSPVLPPAAVRTQKHHGMLIIYFMV